MTLTKMAEQYRDGAAKVRSRAVELEKLAGERGICEMERLRLRSRAAILLSMWREMRGTAFYLENYYKGGHGIGYTGRL